MNLLTRVMAAEEDQIEAALLRRQRLYNAERKRHGLPPMGQPDLRDDAQSQMLLDEVFLPCLPFGQLVADTKWSTGRLFGWFFLEESSNGGLAFLDFDGPMAPETKECETFFNAAATARDKESLFVVLAPLVFSRFLADGTQPQPALFMFRGRSLWHRLDQACVRHTHWPSARTELVLLTLLRLIRVLFEWQGGGRSDISEKTVESLAGVVLESSNQQVLLAGLELIRALAMGNDSSSDSGLYLEGAGCKLGRRLLSLSDRGGAPAAVRELAIDCLHPASISPGFELRGKYLDLTVYYRRNEGQPFASGHLEVILSILTDEDQAVLLTASYLLDSYMSQPGARVTADLLPRIVRTLIANTLLTKPGVPSLVGLCLDYGAKHYAALEGCLAGLPADLSAKLSNHHKEAQNRAETGQKEEREAVREVSAMCLERMATDQQEQVAAELWEQMAPMLRRDSPWQIRESALLLLGVLAQIAPDQADDLVAPHVELLIQSLTDPVLEVRATSSWTLGFYVPLVADSRLSAIVAALLAMVRSHSAKTCQSASSALVHLLRARPPRLDEEMQAAIVRGCLAIWDSSSSPKELVGVLEVLEVFSEWARNGAAGESRAELVAQLTRRLLAQLHAPCSPMMQTAIFITFANLAGQGTSCACRNIPEAMVVEVVEACVSPYGGHALDDELPAHQQRQGLHWALRVLRTLVRGPRAYDLSALVLSPDVLVNELIKPGLTMLTVETLEDCFTFLDHVVEHWPQALALKHSQITPSLFNLVLRLRDPHATLFPLLVRMGLAYATPDSQPPLSDYVSPDTLAALPLAVLLAWADALLPDSPGELLRGLTRQPEPSADATQYAARLVQAHARVIVELLTTSVGDLPDTFGPRERAAMLRLFCHHHTTNRLKAATTDQPLATRALELLIAGEGEGEGEAVAAQLRATLTAAELSALVLVVGQLLPADHAFSRLLA